MRISLSELEALSSGDTSNPDLPAGRVTLGELEDISKGKTKGKGPKFKTAPGLSVGTLLGIDTPDGILPAESTGGSGTLAGYLGDPISAPPAINPHMKSRVPEGIVDRLFNPVETMLPILGPTATQWKERMAPGGQALRDFVSTNINQPGSGLIDAAFPSKEIPFPRFSQGKPGEEFIGNPASSPLDLGVAANFASGVPGALASTATDIGTMTAEQAPELAAMNLSGTAAKAAGVFPAMAKGVHGLEKFVQTGLGGKAPSMAWPGFQLTYLGGFLPETATARTAMMENEQVAKDAAVRMAERLRTADTGAVLSQGEREWMGWLITQPRVRAELRNLESMPTDISAYLQEGPAAMKPTIESLAIPIPRRADLPIPAVPATKVKPYNFARVTEDAAAMFGVTKREMEKRLLMDPAHASEFVEGAYSPLFYADKKLATYPYSGTYSNVRGTDKGFLKARKQLTEEWRKAHGIIEDPSAPFAKRYIQEMHEINSNDYFRSIATTPGAMIGADAFPGAEAGTRKMIGGELYQKMPMDDKLPFVSGQWVRAQEAVDALAMIKERSFLSRFMDSAAASWRFGVTVLNPMTGNRNIVTDILQAHSYGLPFYDIATYGKVGRDLAVEGPIFKMLKDGGASWLTDSRSTRLADMFNEAGMGSHGSANVLQEAMLKSARYLRENRVSAWVAENYYGAMDKQVKSALAWKLHSGGMSLPEAIKRADTALVNYSQMPKMVTKLRSSALGIPFISWDYGQAQNMVNLAVENPAMFKRAAITLDAVNEAAFQAIGATDDERQAMKELYPGKLMMVFPFRDAGAHPMAMNVTPWNPYQNLTNAVRGVPTGTSGLLGYPLQVAQNVAMRNPLVNIGAGLLTGTNPQTGSQIAPPLGSGAKMGTLMEMLGKDPNAVAPLADPLASAELQGRGRFLSQAILPPILGGRVTQNLVEAAKGKPNYFGRTTSLPEALMEQTVTGRIAHPYEDRARAAMALKTLLGQGAGALKREVKSR